MWLSSVDDLLRVVLVGAAAYAALLLVLRATGKRTLAKLNAFDLIVTVAFGSALATVLLSSDVTWSARTAKAVAPADHDFFIQANLAQHFIRCLFQLLAIEKDNLSHHFGCADMKPNSRPLL